MARRAQKEFDFGEREIARAKIRAIIEDLEAKEKPKSDAKKEAEEQRRAILKEQARKLGVP